MFVSSGIVTAGRLTAGLSRYCVRWQNRAKKKSVRLNWVISLSEETSEISSFAICYELQRSSIYYNNNDSMSYNTNFYGKYFSKAFVTITNTKNVLWIDRRIYQIPDRIKNFKYLYLCYLLFEIRWAHTW